MKEKGYRIVCDVCSKSVFWVQRECQQEPWIADPKDVRHEHICPDCQRSMERLKFCGGKERP
jgi:hypothetical protein